MTKEQTYADSAKTVEKRGAGIVASANLVKGWETSKVDGKSPFYEIACKFKSAIQINHMSDLSSGLSS